jgi:hypothetical protein
MWYTLRSIRADIPKELRNASSQSLPQTSRITSIEDEAQPSVWTNFQMSIVIESEKPSSRGI